MGEQNNEQQKEEQQKIYVQNMGEGNFIISTNKPYKRKWYKVTLEVVLKVLLITAPLFLAFYLPFILSGRSCKCLVQSVLPYVDYYEHYQCRYEYYSRQCKKTWPDTYLDLTVYECRYGIDPCASCEVSDDKVIYRHREAQKKS